MKNSKREFCNQEKGKDSIPLLKNEKGELTAVDMEKSDLINEFASAFPGSQTSHITQVSETPSRPAASWAASKLE